MRFALPIPKYGGYDTVRNTTPAFPGLASGDVAAMLFGILIRRQARCVPMLTPEERAARVDGCSQRAQIVVQTHALNRLMSAKMNYAFLLN